MPKKEMFLTLNSPTLKYTFLALAVVGTVLPYSQFVPWVAKNGLDISLLLVEATANPISSFAWADVGVSGISLLLMIYCCRTMLTSKQLILLISCSLSIGVSFGLPFLVYCLLDSEKFTALFEDV